MWERIDVTFDDVMPGLSQTLELTRTQKVNRLRLFNSVVRGESEPKRSRCPPDRLWSRRIPFSLGSFVASERKAPKRRIISG